MAVNQNSRQTMTNTRDIAELTTAVGKLAQLQQFEADRSKEDRTGVKEMVVELKGLNEKISAMGAVQKEMAQNAKDVTELRTRVDQLKEWKDKYDLSKMGSRIEALETTKEREEGATRAISTGADWFWRLFGPIVTAIMIGGLAYFASHSSNLEGQPYGAIGGE